MSQCGILSFSFICNIFLSIALCIDLIFVICCLFIAHVSHPYAVVGIMHWLKTCLYIQVYVPQIINGHASGLSPNCLFCFFFGTEAALTRPPKAGSIKGGQGACSPANF